MEAAAGAVWAAVGLQRCLFSVAESSQAGRLHPSADLAQRHRIDSEPHPDIDRLPQVAPAPIAQAHAAGVRLPEDPQIAQSLPHQQ